MRHARALAQAGADASLGLGNLALEAVADEGGFDALRPQLVRVEFDDFGKEFYIDPEDRGFAGGVFARDIERVQVVKRLVDDGFAEQLLITNDICLKSMLRHYGGWGYDHILRHVVPMLRHEGVEQSTIDQLLVENPKRLLPMRT